MGVFLAVKTAIRNSFVGTEAVRSYSQLQTTMMTSMEAAIENLLWPRDSVRCSGSFGITLGSEYERHSVIVCTEVAHEVYCKRISSLLVT